MSKVGLVVTRWFKICRSYKFLLFKELSWYYLNITYSSKGFAWILDLISSITPESSPGFKHKCKLHSEPVLINEAPSWNNSSLTKPVAVRFKCYKLVFYLIKAQIWSKVDLPGSMSRLPTKANDYSFFVSLILEKKLVQVFFWVLHQERSRSRKCFDV